MELFTNSGHLTDQALLSLVREQDFDNLARLEIAEHLAYCDRCLQRYTELLSAQSLLIPENSCRVTIWRRIRRRTLRILTSRYAAAAAAVVLALTILWGDTPLTSVINSAPAEPPSLTERWDQSLDSLLNRVHTFFDHLDHLTELK